MQKKFTVADLHSLKIVIGLSKVYKLQRFTLNLNKQTQTTTTN